MSYIPTRSDMKIKEFDDFPEAFDYCRESDKPVVVIIKNEKWKLYPSGYAKMLANGERVREL